MRFLSLLLIAISTFVACGGDDDCNQQLVIPTLSATDVFDENIRQIKNYIDQNGLTAIETESGLHVVTTNEGETAKPTICDNVTVEYSGYLLDGTEFDSGSVSFSLLNVIKGWQEGIPKFGKDGTGILLIPSYLAYGTNPPSNSGIPVNAVLAFDINLLDF